MKKALALFGVAGSSVAAFAEGSTATASYIENVVGTTGVLNTVKDYIVDVGLGSGWIYIYCWCRSDHLAWSCHDPRRSRLFLYCYVSFRDFRAGCPSVVHLAGVSFLLGCGVPDFLAVFHFKRR